MLATVDHPKLFLPGLAPKPRFGKHYELLVLSYGGGQDSTALLLKLLFDKKFQQAYSFNHLLIIMSDTGNEHDHTYQYVRNVVAPLCESEKIEFIFLTKDMGYHSPTWPDLLSFFERTDTCGCKGARFHVCSVRLKVDPIYKVLESWMGRRFDLKTVDPDSKVGSKKKGFYEFAGKYGPIGMIIGFARGEEDRRAPIHTLPRWSQETVQRIYPLIDLEMDRAKCQKYIADQGVEVPFPSACEICQFQPEQSLLWLYLNKPAMYERWVKIEAAKLAKFAHLGAKNHGVWPNRTLPEVLEEAMKKYGAMSREALVAHKFSNGHDVKSQY